MKPFAVGKSIRVASRGPQYLTRGNTFVDIPDALPWVGDGRPV